MNRRILCIDDEPHVLEALERSLGESFEVETFTDPNEALTALEHGDFAAVMTDMRMPLMSGSDLLSRARNVAPSTVRLLLTGQADVTSAAAAVNDGEIYRFLVKPCANDRMTAALEAAVEQHRLVTAERELLERTLTSVVKVLTDVLAVAAPEIFERSARVQKYVGHMAKTLAVAEPWRYEVAAALSHIGCIALPGELLAKAASGARLSPSEQRMFDGHVELGHRLLVKIPRLSEVAAIVRAQRARPTTSDVIGVGVRLLRVASDLDARVQGGANLHDAVTAMTAAATADDKPYLAALARLAPDRRAHVARTLRIEELQTGMIFDEDVRTHCGMVLMRAGMEISVVVLERLYRFSERVGVVQPIRVSVPTSMAA